MTCVVGIADKGRVVLAGDTLAVANDLTKYWLTEGKVFKPVEELAIGFAGSLKDGQVVRHTIQIPTPIPDTKVMGWVLREFVPCLKGTLAAHGSLIVRDDGTQECHSEYLLGLRGRLFIIDSDFCVTEHIGYAAIGNAAELARAALMATEGKKGRLEQKAKQALEVAEQLNAAVEQPFTMVSVR